LRTLETVRRAYLVVVVLAGALVSACPAFAAPPVARLDPAPCAPALAAVPGVACYALTVPENRAVDATRTISVPVVVRHAQNGAKLDHAVMFTVGGPGSDTMYQIERKVRNVPLVRTEDVVWFEQRGVGSASPALNCPEYTAARLANIEHNLSREAAEAGEVAAVRACHAHLVALGVDPGGYTTEEIANDVLDLGRLLGYKRLDLYGISYSGTVMLAVARLQPDAVRSIFLDSTLPADVAFDEVGLTNLYRAFDAVFADCEGDVACRRAYKGSALAFRRLLTTLAAHPLHVTLKDPDGRPLAFEVNGRAAFDALSNELYDPAAALTLPKTVFATLHGDDRALLDAVQSNIGPSYFTWGQRLSVWCHDLAAYNDWTVVDAEDKLYPDIAGLVSEVVPQAVCAAWAVGSLSPPNDPVAPSNIPALIYGGEFDPNIPPSWETHIAAGFTKAQVVEFPSRSHLAGETTCGWQILAVFIANPGAPLDVRCASHATYRFAL
jgi:pimeloyl-ACP methyl ester carboxylesterase